MAEDKLFVEATEEDVPSIIGLRQRIWSTTYRGIYPDSMIDEFDWDRHRGNGTAEGPSPGIFRVPYPKGSAKYRLSDDK